MAGYHVLVVEDKYFIADDLRAALVARGAQVVGPVGRPEDAIALLDTSPRIDIAVLNVDLHGEPVFGLAETLQAGGVPFVFATGYGAETIPVAYRDVPRWEKPLRQEALLDALPQMITTSRLSLGAEGWRLCENASLDGRRRRIVSKIAIHLNAKTIPCPHGPLAR